MQGIKIKLAGREYSLSPPGREELKLLDKYVMEHRQSILQLIKPHLAGLDKDQQQFLLRQALEMEAAKPIGGVSQLEYASVLDTRDGYAFLFWLLARKHQPSITLADVEQLVVDATDDEFARLVAERDWMMEEPHGERQPSGGESAADPVGGPVETPGSADSI